MDELNDLIQIYENVVDPSICQFLVDFFEKSTEKHEIIDKDKKPSFTQLNLTENREVNEEVNNIHNFFIQKTILYRDKYYEFIDKRVFPPQHAFEQYRIKRYNTGGEEMFDTHVDVMDHASSRRFLCFLWYLNDVEEGGNTVFKDLIIKPKVGTLLVFPPLWMYPHRGESPISNTKYIMSTYLHYK
jgi:hypothetical protein